MEHFYETIDGWFDYADFYAAMVHRFDSGHFVEVGTWMGKSAAFMATEIFNSGKPIRLDCVDHFRGSAAEIDDVHACVRDTDIKVICTKNLSPFSEFVHIVQCESVYAANRYEDQSLNFVFIDAGHLEDEVAADIVAWLPKVKRGGVLAGHDIDHHHPGVKRAVERLLPDYKTVSANCWMVEI